MEVIAYKILFVLLYLVLTIALFSTALGFPGNWVLVGTALVVALVTKFTAMTWGYLLLCVGLAVLGEVVESLLGAVIVARRGGGRYGIAGSIVGGLVGAIAGAGIMPPLGSVVFAFVGAFAGAVAGEMIKQRALEPAMRIGFWSLVGRMTAIAVKISFGCVILWIIMMTTWP